MSWALIIAGAALTVMLLLTAADIFGLRWHRYNYTAWVINSPSLLAIGGLLPGLAAKRKDKKAACASARATAADAMRRPPPFLRAEMVDLGRGCDKI